MQRLLLVEDDPALQFTIQTALEANGYAVDAVSTTGDAIERLADEAYPIVVTDIYIDERTGLDVLDAAKRKDPRLLGDSDDRPRHHRNGDGRDARRARSITSPSRSISTCCSTPSRAPKPPATAATTRPKKKNCPKPK